MRFKSATSDPRRPSAFSIGSTIILALAALLMVCAGFQAVAQSSEEIWAKPVNLSRSGAASSPAIVAQPGGGLRVFWWDRFDGVMMAQGTPPEEAPARDLLAEWSDPVSTPIFVIEALERPTPEGEEYLYTPVGAMPRILGDPNGNAHAFWLGEADSETGARPLLYARLAATGATWTTARALAQSATGFDATVDVSGAVHLTYVRDLNTARFPAGVYYQWSGDGGASWRAAVAVYPSRYLRLLSPEEARLDVAADGADGVYVTWDDPRLEGVLLAASLDGGLTWQEPAAVGASTGGAEGRPQGGRAVPVPEERTLLLWEMLRPNGSCALYQAPIEDLLAGTGAGGGQVLPEWTTCLPDKQFLPLAGQGPGAGRVLLAAERNDGSLLLATWNGSSWQRSRPLAFRFVDPELGGRVQLADLRLALNAVPSTEGEEPAQVLAVVGTGEKGEVWFTGGELEALEPALAPVTPTPSPTPRLRLPGAAEEVEAPPEPVNLSRSGAASSPAIVAGPAGTLRAFWWDAFDGLMVADGAVWSSTVLSGTQEVRTTLDIWSDAAQAPILRPEAVEAGPAGDEAAGEQIDFVLIEAMPRIVADASGGSLALWLQGPDVETGAGTLMASTLDAGSIFWSPAEVLAESVAAFDVTGSGPRTLHLAYLRTQHAADAAAGVYHRRSDDGGATWSAPAAVDTSRYYRLLSAESAHLRVAADGAGGVYVTWDDPHLERLLLAGCSDGGATWGEPVTVGDPDGRPQRGRLFSAPGGSPSEARAVWLLWEDASQGGGCALYQAPAPEALQDPAVTGERVLDGLTACPQQAEQFLATGDGGVLMVVGRGSDALTLVAWDGERWSEPRRLGYRFEDPATGAPVYLGDLQAALVETDVGGGPPDEAVVVVGTDTRGDVWVTPSQMGALEVVFAPPSPWSAPVNISQSAATPGLPALAADAEGRLHALWSEGAELYYARREEGGWTPPTAVLGASAGDTLAGASASGAREPSLAALGERLHALWSDGPNGQIWYSRAFIRDAFAASGWEKPRPMPSAEGQDMDAALGAAERPGSWPHLVASGSVLHAVYAVPVNEGRGIYATRSEDGGESWSPARQVFDAAAAGWTAADQPRLAVDAGGRLHVTWVRAALSPDEPPQGVYTARSEDGGETWSEALLAAEGRYAWPQVSVSAPGQVHLLWCDVARGDTWWHRWSTGADEGTADQGVAEGQVGWAGWTRPEQVPGMSGAPGPIGLAAGGAGTLYVAGLGRGLDGAPAVLYLAWAEGRWGAREVFSLALSGAEPGLAAAVQGAQGRLDVVVRGRGGEEDAARVDASQVDVWHTGRALEAAAAAAEAPASLPGPAATPAAEAPGVPEATAVPQATATPTATPGLGAAPASAGGDEMGIPLPLLLGGGLAALIVAGALGARLLWAGRRHRRT